MIEDPTHLIRRNFVQFSKVYLLANQAANQRIYYNIIRLACQEEILINFEFLLIDNSISDFINISCHQVDVNSFFIKYFKNH